MSKNIFEPRYDIATPIAGLTCKPLAILPETISPQEMSLARGGNEAEEMMFKLMSGSSGNSGDSGNADIICQSNPSCYTELPGGQAESGKIYSTADPGGYHQDCYDSYGACGSGSGGGNSHTASADSSASVDATTSADSSGTQDQNGGALDNEIDDFDFWDFNWGQENNNEGEDLVYPTLWMDEDDEGNDENECDVCGLDCCEC